MNFFCSRFLLALLLLQQLAPLCFAQDREDQIVVGFEKTISAKGDPELKLIVETFYIDSAEQFEFTQKYITTETIKALNSNAGLQVEFVHANYVEDSLPNVRPLNNTSLAELTKVRSELGIADIMVTQKSSSNSDIGFDEIISNRQVVATQINLPKIIASKDILDAGPSQSPPSKFRRYADRSLTLVRTVSALGINGFMIYSALGADMLTPVVIPALLFYPALELGFQKMSGKYVKLLKSFKNVYARAGFRTAVSFACIAVHVGLLSSIGLAEFSLLAVSASSMKAALLTHSWWELVVDGKVKKFSGKYVSFGLGIVGMTGLLLESIGYDMGSYILYGLGASGAVLWSRNGAWDLLKNDTVKAAKFFRNKTLSVAKYFQNSCESIGRNLFKQMFNE